jgi:hypothetical protein
VKDEAITTLKCQPNKKLRNILKATKLVFLYCQTLNLNKQKQIWEIVTEQYGSPRLLEELSKNGNF